MRLPALLTLLLLPLPAHAVTLRVSAAALERTLLRQVFNSPTPPGRQPRRYLRGDAAHPCSVYLDTPAVTFAPHVDGQPDRIVVTVHTHAAFGKNLGHLCLGVPISLESQVSFLPTAEGETIGFRDARIDHVSTTSELNALLQPFLAGRLPVEMKINAANLMRTLLVRAPDSTGYTLTLDTLNLHSMAVTTDPRGQALVVDLDANIHVD